MADFMTALRKTLNYEGGYADHPLDKGGKTKYGVTEETARRFGYRGEMRDLSLDFAEHVYRLGYWDELNLNRMASQSVAESVFDAGVNCGTASAGIMLQRALNVLNLDQKLYPDLKIDGVVGPETLRCANTLAGRDEQFLLRALAGERYHYYSEVVKKDPAQEVFFRSWIRRL